MYRIFDIQKNTPRGDTTYIIWDDKVHNYTELSSKELDFLSKFVRIIGVRGSERFVTVCYVGIMLGSYELYNWMDEKRVFRGTKEEVKKFARRGYVLLEKGLGFKYFDNRLSMPSLLMRTGMNIIVTDRGKLLYLDALHHKYVVLGDFCNELCRGSVCNGSYDTVFVIDSRIKRVDAEFALHYPVIPVVDISKYKGEWNVKKDAVDILGQ